jgi:murein DD-endopeptidase MepM/ murein hydrolase activator NlpD
VATALAAALALCAASAGGPTVSVQPGTAKPGDPVFIVVEGAAALPTGTLGDRALRFYPFAGRHEAIAGLSVDHPVGVLEISIRVPAAAGAKAAEIVATIDVVDANYPRRELRVARKFIQPPPDARARIAADRAAFRRAWSQPFVPRMFEQRFDWPRIAWVTAPFGDLRLFNGKRRSQHYGIDLDGNTGAPIQAANDGVVVMVRDCYSSGNTIIIHHGGGLFTAYFHLSKFLVKPRQKVKRGELIGLVGKTGRVTGPHLHWSVHAGGFYVDGATLMQLDFGVP